MLLKINSIILLLLCATHLLAATEDDDQNNKIPQKQLEKIDKKLSKLLAKKQKAVSKIKGSLTPEKQTKIAACIANSNKLSETQKTSALEALDQASEELEKATKE